MGGGLESRCVGRVYGADGAVRRTIRTVKQSSNILSLKPLEKLTSDKIESLKRK